jgi:PIN domain nuclease of toxin-antitoxin system
MGGPEVNYLLDTSVWVNRTLIPEVIPTRVRNLLRDNVCGAFTVSFLETAILHRLGRLPLAGTLEDFFTLAHGQDIEAVELTPNIARLTNDLPDTFQGDPFDRTLMTTARALKLILVTADRRIRDANFCNVEFYPFKPSRA